MNTIKYIFALFAIVGSTCSNSQGLSQVCNENIEPSTPMANFTINDDGTIIDNKSDLMWMRCTYGQDYINGNCAGIPASLYWNEALNAAEQFEYASHTDWRLPNIKELVTIMEDRCTSPAINLDVFPNTNNWIYWSSTVKSNTVSHIYFVMLFSGDMWFDEAYYEPYNIRLVRSVE